MRPLLSRGSSFAILLLLAACAGGMRPPAGGAGAPAPTVAVERFLQLAGEREYLGMGWLFGTATGAVLERDPAAEVEQRMFALATLLQNEGYEVGTGTSVPGRVGAAQRFDVRLRRGGREHSVPIVAVRGPGGRWLVEQVDVEAVTGRP